ncbi:MAG TPA: hypothetical protein ENI60_03620 [Candidatus Fraserbacteria bacterium]|nr:hypothetical protein [Candidatus Fraserbacteria bacterium]
MQIKIRILAVGLLLGALLLAGVTNLTAQAQQDPHPSSGARQLIRSFFIAMTAGDLVLLKDGGAISGTVQDDQFKVELSSGGAKVLKRSEIALISFGGKTDQLVLTSGDLLSGTIQAKSLSIVAPNGDSLTLPQSAIATMIFKLDLPTKGHRPANPRALFKLFRSLRSQNIFLRFARSLTSFDLAVFPNRELWSGKVTNQQFVFHSALFGTLTFKTTDVAAIELASDPKSGSDFITLKSGDRLSGALDAKSAIEFQPVGLSAQAQSASLTLKRGEVTQVVFRLPASAFGGGHGPGFQGGPGK